METGQFPSRMDCISNIQCTGQCEIALFTNVLQYNHLIRLGTVVQESSTKCSLIFVAAFFCVQLQLHIVLIFFFAYFGAVISSS